MNQLSTEIKHTLMLRFGTKKRRLLFDYIILPFIVSTTIMLAFIARESPGDHRMGLIFFSTLYAFWCGLFGTCQVFNGEVASGEWSYWTLGLHRSRLHRLLAHIITSCAAVTVQVGLCLLFLFPLSLIIMPLSGTNMSFVNAFDSAYLKDGAFGLASLKSMMSAGEVLIFFRFVFSYYALGMFAAAISGIGLGILVSTLFRDTQSSLIFSVCVIVLSSILSHMTLQGYEISESQIRDFSPSYLEFKIRCHSRSASESLPMWKDGGVLEFCSRFLPQRYFYNVSRMPILKLKGADLSVDELKEHTQKPIAGCKCLACICELKVYEDYILDRRGLRMPIASHWVTTSESTTHSQWNKLLGTNRIKDISASLSSDDNDLRRINNQKTLNKIMTTNFSHVDGLFSLYSRMLCGELGILTFMFVAHLGLAFVRLTKGEMFNELR